MHVKPHPGSAAAQEEHPAVRVSVRVINPISDCARNRVADIVGEVIRPRHARDTAHKLVSSWRGCNSRNATRNGTC